ncbi:MAG: SDR family oxidoreductase [Planctomycetaceae bacterium]
MTTSEPANSAQPNSETHTDSPPQVNKLATDSHDTLPQRALVIGCGYLGSRVAQAWVQQGVQVSALTRSSETAERFRASGLAPILGDVLQPETLAALPAVDVVLYAVGYDRNSSAGKREVYVDGLRHVLASIDGRSSERPCRLIYVSSSSVYGQSQGEWVDEQSPTEPTTEGGEICLAAERLLEHRPETIRLRLSGIYGPGRLLARIEQLQQGLTLEGNPEAWLNLIHVDDAARAVLATARHGSPQPLYLVSDDQPITRRDYYSQLAALVQAPVPQFAATKTGSPSEASSVHVPSRSSKNKRCRNRLLHSLLNDTLLYPTIATGLPNAIAPDGQHR